MDTFKINIQEVLSRTIDVQAQNIEDAVSKANQMYHSAQVVLDYNDLSKRKIIPNDLIDERESITKQIIEYLYQDEKKHFEELEEPYDHIFLKLERLKMLID